MLRGVYFPPDVSVIIGDGKIQAMPGLPGQPIDFPADLTINLGGRAVIPALFNTHCHIQMMNGLRGQDEQRERQIARNMFDCLSRGITNIRDTLSYDLRLNRALSARIARGEIPGPRIQQAVHVSPLGGTYAPRRSPFNRMLLRAVGLTILPYQKPESGVVTFSPGASTQEVRDAVDRAIAERGAETIKFCDQPEHILSYKPGAAVITREQLEAAADQARKRRVHTTIHNVTVDGFRQAVGAGVQSLAHLPIDGELSDADVNAFLQSGISLEPTLTVGYYFSWKIAGNRWRDDPEMTRMDTFREKTYTKMAEESWLAENRPHYLTSPAEALRSGSLKWNHLIDLSAPFRYFAGAVPVGLQNFRALFAAGGSERMALGNDATVSACSQAVIHLELELFEHALYGGKAWDAATALRIATIQSARAMDLEQQFGSIQTGKTADLVVLDGDPLSDFHLIGSPAAALFMDGSLIINRCDLRPVKESAGNLNALNMLLDIP